MCTNNYSTKERFDSYLQKLKGAVFLPHSVEVEVCVVSYRVDLLAVLVFFVECGWIKWNSCVVSGLGSERVYFSGTLIVDPHVLSFQSLRLFIAVCRIKLLIKCISVLCLLKMKF